MTVDKANTTSFRLLWDSEFYYQLLKGLIALNDTAAWTLLSSFAIRACTVFVHEMTNYEPHIGEAVLNSSTKLFKDSYPIIRDRIHYFSSHPFNYESEKADSITIVGDMQKSFITKPKDAIYHLRHDLSYIKHGDEICCSSMDINALTYGTPLWKNGQVIGKAIEQYSADLSSIISSVRAGFVSTGMGKIIFLDELLPTQIVRPVFFDGKFDIAVEKSEFTEYVTALSLRMLSDVGSLLFFVDAAFTNKWNESNWLYFVVRLIAIRYDEISDAIYKIATEFPHDESALFIKLLTRNGIYPFPRNIRQVAKRLRNSIHYNSDSEIWSVDLSKSFYWHDCFLKQASVTSMKFEKWPTDYIMLKNAMMSHLNKLHELLSNIFDCELVLSN